MRTAEMKKKSPIRLLFVYLSCRERWDILMNKVCALLRRKSLFCPGLHVSLFVSLTTQLMATPLPYMPQGFEKNSPQRKWTVPYKTRKGKEIQQNKKEREIAFAPSCISTKRNLFMTSQPSSLCNVKNVFSPSFSADNCHRLFPPSLDTHFPPLPNIIYYRRNLYGNIQYFLVWL